jgi:hypothetical protein
LKLAFLIDHHTNTQDARNLRPAHLISSIPKYWNLKDQHKTLAFVGTSQINCVQHHAPKQQMLNRKQPEEQE